MRIVQIVPTISFGDAISNDALALSTVLVRMDPDTGIYCENIDPRVQNELVHSIKNIGRLHKDDIIIYHLSVGTKLNYIIASYKCRKIVRYHNITPPNFFMNYNRRIARLSEEGLNEVRYLADHVDYCFADSSYNKKDLIDMNYRCPIDVLPILIPFSDYDKEPDFDLIQKYSDDWTNIVFVGRIAPHKKQEDVIQVFYYVKKYVNPKSRLFIVGNYSGLENYYDKLKKYVNQLGLKDVYFTGHIKFNQILAYYRLADIFLSMSEHEGFCVPLVEASYFNVPIIAYNSSAIADTLGGSGILLDEKKYLEVAMLIDRIQKDNVLKSKIIEGQRENIKRFRYECIEKQFIEYLKAFINKKY